jgi:hypothetical protein
MKRTLPAIAVIAIASLGMAAVQDFAAAPVVAGQGTVVAHGEAVLSGGKVTINLPAWFETQAKAEGRAVVLTPRGNHASLYASAIAAGKFTVQSDGNCDDDQAFTWVVFANHK